MSQITNIGSRGRARSPGVTPGQRRVGELLLVGLLVGVSLVLGASIVLLGDGPGMVIGVSMALLGGLLLWRVPIAGVYTMVGGAVLFERHPLHYPDSLTDRVPFFHSLDSVGPVPVLLSPVELVLFGTLAFVVLQRVAVGRAPLVLGPFFWPMAALALALVGGIVHGVMTGGRPDVIGLEVRGLFYLPLAYLLIVNLAGSVTHVRRLIWIVLAGIAIKGILGTFRYAITLGGGLSGGSGAVSVNSLMAHEESYFFALYLTFVAAMWLLGAKKSHRMLATAFALPVVIAFLANERRAGVLALLMGLLIVGLLVYATTRARRPAIVLLSLAALVLMPLYVFAFGDDDGLLAEPAVAIWSIYNPDERDLSSNRYRELENENLKLNIARHPLWGAGFGKPVPMFVSLPDLSDVFSLWEYLPHNTVLWLWHRIGIFGFAVFWVMVGRIIIGGIISSKRADDRFLRTIAILSVAAITAWLGIGLVDQGLMSPRMALLVGAMAGLAAKVPVLRVRERVAQEQEVQERESPAHELRPRRD
jgi:hypothetical protein